MGERKRVRTVICKYCGSKTQHGSEICTVCYSKLRLIRQIREMLMPYYERKLAREKKRGGSDEEQGKGV
jgi:hypothetical protein